MVESMYNVQNIFKIVIAYVKNTTGCMCSSDSIIGFYDLKGQQLYDSRTKIKP